MSESLTPNPDVTEPIRTVPLVAGNRYLYVSRGDGIVVGTFVKRTRKGALVFADPVTLNAKLGRPGERFILRDGLIQIDEWRHLDVPLLPYRGLLELEPATAVKLVL
jgi:hypothetical protein